MEFLENQLVYSQATRTVGFISQTDWDTDGSVLYMVEFIYDTPEGIDLRHEWTEEGNLRECTDEEAHDFKSMAELLRDIAKGYLGEEITPPNQGFAR